MLSLDAHSILKAIAVLLIWISCAVVASFFMFPAWEVMKMILVGLSPLIAAIAVLGVTFLVSLQDKRRSKSDSYNERQ
ncbi:MULTISPECIES: hypothetical protein [Pseudomonadaceae]|uniref:hypothetical protein n=1 Tax=Pseudomonadaceae TaxID=135621 RepID=UPI0003760B35|nr:MULTISPECIES: hypothetical protein [Pseudomonadaceae]MBS9726647.1 hypothetical protein [Stutzerimonas stutzeri]QYG43848.1 hypothetical protein J5V74_30730 [Pseudomonas aeruginosa]